MSGNTFGQIFRITTFGESHGKLIGVVIDGCPAGLELDHSFITSEMERRRPGHSVVSSRRMEADKVEIVSGLFENKTTGSPIAILIENEDARPADYDKIKTGFRPSHADYTYFQKYGIRDHRGGGRASARETAARVAAGAVAKLFLKQSGIDILAYTEQIGHVILAPSAFEYKPEQVYASEVRCPDLNTALEMSRLIEKVFAEGDSAGGVVKCTVRGCPAGLGEPVFDKLEAELAKAMLSIPACKGFDIGTGFGAAVLKGSENNDVFAQLAGKVITKTNHSGGVQGGISNGMDILFRAAFKPTASISRPQQTVDLAGNDMMISSQQGRHDPCVVPRAVAVVEAMAALVLADLLLISRMTKMR